MTRTVTSLCLVLTACVTLGALAACDPCSGIVGCSDGRYLAAGGQIVDSVQARGIDGVRIDMVRTGGISVAQDSLSTVTSGGGFWRLEFAPSSAGALDVDVNVSAPGGIPYRLHNLRLETKEHRGDANLNERWVTFLYFDYLGEFFYEGTVDTRVVGARVEFRPTAGSSLSGPGITNGEFHAITDEVGRVYLFPRSGPARVVVSDDGDLIGNLILHLPGSKDSTIVPAARLTPKHTYRDARQFPPVIRWPIAR